MLIRLYFILFATTLMACSQPSKSETNTVENSLNEIQPGAWQIDQYIDHLKNKKIGLLVNHTSMIRETHLVDTLISLGIDVKTVFAPEHGFRGKADAGEHVKSEVTESFDLISLFGAKREPTDDDVSGLDVIVFDIQDVGVRFYTYISTMHYLMEAAARNNIPFIVLDRPNPNGSYVDGSFLNESQRTFVGLHPIPIVHGLTVGELAKMIIGEDWLRTDKSLDLTVITVKNWDHSMPYSLPIKPSPNLPNDLSIALYPSICLFEGTIVSVGRGTPTPFQQIGHPDYPDTSYSFIPKPSEGAKNPKFNGLKCYGVDFRSDSIEYKLSIQPLIDFYNKMPRKDFFTPYIKSLAGDVSLIGDIDKLIIEGKSEAEIKKSWQPELEAYKKMRVQYLLYE